MQNPVLTAIYQRRSIRRFRSEEVSWEDLRELVRAGIWAPSGLNNQPWRFVLVRDQEIRSLLAAQTTYKRVVLAAPALIVVFLDRDAMYNDLKDHQAAGACIQNMLLAAEALGLGAVWLGQILKNEVEVRRILKLDDSLSLMAVIALGHPAPAKFRAQRKPIETFILKTL